MVSRLGLMVVILVGVTSPAVAQGPSAAREAFESGTLAFNESRWQDCATDFERSFTLIFAPELLYNIGLCYHRAAGALPDSVAGPVIDRALSAYQRYVREIPDASDGEVVRGYIADLEVRASRIRRESAESETTETLPAVIEVEPVEPIVAEEVRVTGPTNDYTATISTGLLTVVSTALAVGLGAHAQSLYVGLGETCGQTPGGCSDAQIAELDTFSMGANAMWAISGITLVGTSIGFAVEFTATSTRPALAVLTVGGSF